MEILLFSRLKEYKDTMRLFIFTLNVVTRSYPIITSVEGLPYDCLSVVPCPAALGGVVVLTSNSVIHIDQASRRVALAVNGWMPRVSDMPAAALAQGDQGRLELEGSRMTFVDDKTLFIVLKDGTIHPVEFFVDGKVVSKLSISPPLAQTTTPSVIRKITDEHFFVGSTAGPSALLKVSSVEEDIQDDVEEIDGQTAPAAVVDTVDGMDIDDDDGEPISILNLKTTSY